jgi:hypothetical protein
LGRGWKYAASSCVTSSDDSHSREFQYVQRHM